MCKSNEELAATVGMDGQHNDGSQAYDAEHGKYESAAPSVKAVPVNHQISAPFTAR